MARQVSEIPKKGKKIVKKISKPTKDTKKVTKKQTEKKTKTAQTKKKTVKQTKTLQTEKKTKPAPKKKIQKANKPIFKIPAFAILQYYNPDSQQETSMKGKTKINSGDSTFTVEYSNCYACFSDANLETLGCFSSLELAQKQMYRHIYDFTKKRVDYDGREFVENEENQQHYQYKLPRGTFYKNNNNRNGVVESWQCWLDEVDYLWQIYENKLDQFKEYHEITF